MAPNPYLLAADNSPALLPLLRENPALASGQDEHGYSLVHAAASYNHLDLLRALIQEFKVDVDLRDEDNETALFVVETVDAAKVLVEELGADVTLRGAEGFTAREKIEGEADFPEVAEYLKSKDSGSGAADGESQASVGLPKDMTVSMSTITPAEQEDMEVDPEFRARIEHLAQREDFHSDEAQAELRRLVADAVADRTLTEERNVKPRQD